MVYKVRVFIIFILEMIVQKLANIFKIFHARLQIASGFEGFSNHACLSMLDCEALSYHFKSIYYKHHHVITNESNYLTLKDYSSIGLNHIYPAYPARSKMVYAVHLYHFVSHSLVFGSCKKVLMGYIVSRDCSISVTVSRKNTKILP